MRLDEPPGQEGRGLVRDPESLRCLQGLDRDVGEDLREPGEGGFLANDDATGLAHPSGREPSRPGKAGGVGVEFRLRHGVVGLVPVAAFGPAPARLGDPGFEGDDLVSVLLRLRPADHVEHARDVVTVLGLLVLERIFQVIVAIRKAQSGLGRVERILGRVLLVLVHRHEEETRAETASRTSHQHCNVGLGLGVADRGQIVCDRRGVELFDPRFIHERVVERADLARVAVGGGAGLGRILDDRADLFLRLVAERFEHAETGLVRRDCRPRSPCPVGIVEEAVPRVGLPVHAGNVEAPGAVPGRGRGLSRRPIGPWGGEECERRGQRRAHKQVGFQRHSQDHS